VHRREAAEWDGVAVDDERRSGARAVDAEAEQAVRAGAGGVRQGHAGPVAQHRPRRRRRQVRRGRQALLRPAGAGRRPHRVRQGALPGLPLRHRLRGRLTGVWTQ